VPVLPLRAPNERIQWGNKDKIAFFAALAQSDTRWFAALSGSKLIAAHRARESHLPLRFEEFVTPTAGSSLVLRGAAKPRFKAPCVNASTRPGYFSETHIPLTASCRP